jgi:hypothetical protein
MQPTAQQVSYPNRAVQLYSTCAYKLVWQNKKGAKQAL